MTLCAPEPLTKDHDFQSFSCGVPSMDNWLFQRAHANQATGASRTYVIRDDERVIGYYALASGSIASTDSAGRFRRNMPDPIPVVVPGRLAIDQRYHGAGLGRALVRDAAMRVEAAGETIGVRGLIVHAISGEAKSFYQALGFGQSPTHPMTLMISLADLKANL